MVIKCTQCDVAVDAPEALAIPQMVNHYKGTHNMTVAAADMLPRVNVAREMKVEEVKQEEKAAKVEAKVEEKSVAKRGRKAKK